MSIINKMAAAGTLSKQQQARVTNRVQSFVKAAQQDPRLMAEALEKLGGAWESVKAIPGAYGRGVTQQVPAAAANLTALALIGGAVGIGSDAYKSYKENSEKAKAYKDMMEIAGERLADIPAAQIQNGFNTLHRINPNYAQDPIVAAEFIRETNRSEAYPFQLLNIIDKKREVEPNFATAYKGIISPLKVRDLDAPVPEETSQELAAKEKELFEARRAVGMPYQESPQEQASREKALYVERRRRGLKP